MGNFVSDKGGKDMFLRRLVLAAAGIAVISGVSLTMSQPAEARASCSFIAVSKGRIVADGFAKAIKKKWACNRAQRRCNRERNRKIRRGVLRPNRGDLMLCEEMQQAV